MERQVEAAPDHQVSLTDPDARSMNSSGRETGIVGYNLQAAVDTKHHLIVAHEVVTEGNDRVQLVPMGLNAKHAMGVDAITVLADRGYYNGDQVLACEGAGVLPCIPKSHTAIGIKTGMFSRHDFVYDAEQDHYTCPAGATLTKATARSDRRDEMDQYRNLAACHACALRPRCTPERTKRVMRWKHEGVLDVMQARLDRLPDAVIVRRKADSSRATTVRALRQGRRRRLGFLAPIGTGKTSRRAKLPCLPWVVLRDACFSQLPDPSTFNAFGALL